jgi:hypothetical protein
MDADVAYWQVTLTMAFAGVGMGPSLPLFTLAIQNAVDVRRLGQATSAAQFFRQIGGTMGAAVMGAVLAATLGLSFSRLELPSALTADEAGSVERLAATGGGTLPSRIRDAYAGLAADVTSAVTGADAQAMAALARSPDLPAAVSLELGRLAGSAELASGSPDASAVAERLSDQVTARGEASAAEVREGVRLAFADATHRIYTLAVALAAAALLLAFRVPELPLRKTHDRVVVAE